MGGNPGRGASVSLGCLGFVCGMDVMVHFLPAVARGVSGAGSGFRVGWRTVVGGGLISIFGEFSSSFGNEISYDPEATRIYCLLIIIAHRFTCGERKIW